LKDPYRYFRLEAREILDALARGILALDRGDARLDELLRASHTLKGAASVVQEKGIARAAHELEEKLAAGAPVASLLPILDGIESALARLGEPVAEAAPVRESVRTDLEEVDALLAVVADVGARLGASQEVLAAREVEGWLARLTEWIAASRAAAASPSWERADELLAGAREALRRQRGDATALVEGAEHRSRTAIERARRLRLLPTESVFQDLARAAHDAASRAGCDVELETVGGELRVDAHVLTLVRDALVQMIRNAVAHGIEPSEERAQRGKPARATIRVRFALRGSRIVVTCRDDGRGLDRDALRSALEAKGVATTTDIDLATLLGLVMKERVSTREEATELSGRGVGLGVVGDVLERLRGRLTVESAPGIGVGITMDVPVSLTAAPALVVRVGGIELTLPLDAVRRTTRIEPNVDEILFSEREAYRFVPLARVLRLEASAPQTAVLLDEGVAFGVDAVLGVASEVTQPLPPHARAEDFVAGASLDGHGVPRLALAPAELARAVRTRSTPPRREERPARRVLVVDDSRTARALEQSLLEEAGYAVTTAGSGEEAMDLVHVASFDLFVVDVEMGNMDGFELVRRLRERFPNVPSMLVSSLSGREVMARGLAAGARDYVVKGDPRSLLAAARRLTE